MNTNADINENDEKTKINQNKEEKDIRFSEWSSDHEKIFVEWADKAMCYRWLHAKSHTIYATQNAWYTIPVIIISTLTGTANFAQDRIPRDYQGSYAIIVGGFSILAGIITTIQQFLKITQLTEAHRVSSIAWDKFYRNIKTELAKHPNERMGVLQLLKITKEEFDRLMETSPTIPDKVIDEFKIKFKNDEVFSDISKPEICDVMIGTEKYRNPWYTDDNKNKELQKIIETNNKELQKIIEANNKELDEKKQIYQNNINMVNDFIKKFYTLNNRDPLESEIIDNLKDSIEINILKGILNEKIIIITQN
jgi:hypothetical protein